MDACTLGQDVLHFRISAKMAQNAFSESVGGYVASCGPCDCNCDCDCEIANCPQIRMFLENILEENWEAACFERWRTLEHQQEEEEELAWLSWKQLLP